MFDQTLSNFIIYFNFIVLIHFYININFSSLVCSSYLINRNKLYNIRITKLVSNKVKNYFSLFFKNNEKSDRKRKIHNYIFRNFSMILSLQKKKMILVEKDIL